MTDNMKRCAFHILQIESNIVRNNEYVCKYKRRVMRSRYTPYHMLDGTVILPRKYEIIHERTHRKSENSDAGNENDDFKDSEIVKDHEIVSSVGLFKSKSLENINSSSHNFDFTQDCLFVSESGKNSYEASDVELVSSKMKCLKV